MMPQTQNADYSNGTNNNAVGIAVAPQNGQYVSNTSMSGQIPIMNSSIPNQNLIAAANYLNQTNQSYMAPGLATINYIYPNNNSFVQASNLVFNPHNILHPPVEMIASGPSSLGHIGTGGNHHNHKIGGYDNMQHFGSLSQSSSRKPKNSVMSKTNLYINGLQETDTDESVRALVEGIIDPKSCKAMMSHGKCRGSGFIDCANENDAETVIHILRNKQMPGGTRLAVKFAYENEKDDLNVYVRNLPRTSSFNNSNLEDMFKEFGQVVSVKLLQSDNQYTGTGFVRFSAADEAQRAVDHMNIKKLLLAEEDKPVICKLADKGGRRMNHSLVSSCGDPQAQSLDGSNDLLGNGCVLNDGGAGEKAVYGMSLLAGAPYGHQGQHQQQQQHHQWLGHHGLSGQDLLTQELQSLSLGQSASYLLPALMPYGGGGVAPGNGGGPGNNEAEALAMQQQLLAQLVWAHQQQQQQQNPSRLLSGYHHPQQQHHQPQHWQAHHQQQQQQQQQQVPSNGGFFDPAYQQPLLYTQQFRPAQQPSTAVITTRPPAIKAASGIDSMAAAVANGQSSPPPSQGIPALVNGNVPLDQQQHQQQAKM